MIYVFGIERSLQLLTAVNIGLGAQVMFSIYRIRPLGWGTAGLTAAALMVLILNPHAFGMWDRKYFAIFQNNQPEAYNTPERKQDALENTEVLFYHEGVDSTISSIKIKGGNQAILVNGKVVASSALKDRQCQLTLGHLPMLLHKNPRRVLVVGLGTGMTLGATSVHPNVEELILAEIEPKVVGAARTFAPYNNHALDNPKLKIVFNDGRNFLMTTPDRYDVITADPIHKLEISAVMARVSQERAAAIFVDNAARIIYGQRYFSGINVDQAVSGFIAEVMSTIGAVYRREAQMALRQGMKYPAADPTMKKIREVITEKVQESRPF